MLVPPMGFSTFRGFPLAPADTGLSTWSAPRALDLWTRPSPQGPVSPKRYATPFGAAYSPRSVAHTEACTHLEASRSQTGTEAPAQPSARNRAGVASRHTGLRAAEAVRRRSDTCCAEQPRPKPCHSQSRQHSHSWAGAETDAEATAYDNPGAATSLTNTPKRARERPPHRPTENSRRSNRPMRTSSQPEHRGARDDEVGLRA